LEASGRRRELVTESVVLHVDTDEVVESGSREAEDTRNFFGVEEVGGFVPVDPHATEVVAEKVVQRVSRKETQAVGDPVCLAGILVVVRLCALPQLTDRLGTLLVCARPDAEGDTVQSVRGILLEDECMVDAVRLHSASADFDIVRETCLGRVSILRYNAWQSLWNDIPSWQHEGRGQCRCPALVSDCFRESQEARTDRRRPSCVQSFLVEVVAP
jgi:hypothetical protein